MPLDDYSPADEAFFRKLDSRASRMTGEQPPDADGGLQASGWGGHEMLQADDFDHVQHYGFRSTPPKDTEYVRVPGDPSDTAVAERVTPPTALPSRATGDSLIHGPDGNSFVHCDGSGNVVITAESTKKVLIGRGGSTAGVARLDDTVKALTSMAAWLATVSTHVGTAVPTDFGAIQTASTVVEVE